MSDAIIIFVTEKELKNVDYNYVLEDEDGNSLELY